MSISLLNFGMLLGMLGISVPILVHLLNRRRFDIVPWGAMQFLQLGERTRQRIRLSDLFLLLLRMGLVALLVLAFSRPFVQGNPWLRSLNPEPIDLVMIIDSSYSMGATAEVVTPHARGIQTCHEMLDRLTSVDRVAIIDARERPHLLTPAPLTDTANARLQLEKLQQPDGSADLVAALKQACQLLTQSFSPQRDVVVITDKQQSSWRLQEQAVWNEMLRLRHAAAVPIQFSAIDVGSATMEQRANFQVAKLHPSRELLVTDTAATFTTRVSYQGPAPEASCQLFWSIDGQLLSRETETLQLRNGEQAVVEFTTRFADAGSHLISASVEPDSLPGDDLSQCLVEVVADIPVVIAVNSPAETGSESPTFDNSPHESDTHGSQDYLRFAFGNPDLQAVWVHSRVLPLMELSRTELLPTRLVFLIGPPPADYDWEPLTNYLLQGGSVVIIPESRNSLRELQRFHQWQFQDQPLLPMQFANKVEICREADAEKWTADSFQAEWLQKFQASTNHDLLDLQFTHYWNLTPFQPESTATTNSSVTESSTAVDLKFPSGHPAFVRRTVGSGQILLSAVSFDGLENDLIRQRSFVPFLHELVFGLTNNSSQRNVDLGQPLILNRLPCQPLTIPVKTPDQQQLTAQRSGTDDRYQWVLAPPRLSGIYHFQTDCGMATTPNATTRREIPFQVHAPRRESDLKRLTAEDLNQLRNDYQLEWRNNSGELLAQLASSSGGLEIWPLLLFLVTAFLVLELLMTRRLVQGGHTDSTDRFSGFGTTDNDSSPAPQPDSEKSPQPAKVVTE